MCLRCVRAFSLLASRCALGLQQERKDVTFVMLIVGIIMAIVSISSAITAYTQFETATGEFRSIIKNWRTKPLVDFLLADPVAGCAEGYKTLEIADWPGTYSDACACPQGASISRAGATGPEDVLQSSSSGGECNADQIEADCVDQRSLDKVLVTGWRGKAVCYKQGGSAQLEDEVIRAIPASAGKCPSGNDACGVGTMQTDRTTCVKTGEACPLTTITFGAGSSGANADTATIGAASVATSSHGAAQVAMPFNQIKFALASTAGAYSSGKAKFKRGVCFELKGPSKEQDRYKAAASSYVKRRRITFMILQECWL